ncbi:hypothetical protein T06_15800 [Trichinella sp. T6]|nr:hypothetical protein T06_15800 [Trichinella sp. T6]
MQNIKAIENFTANLRKQQEQHERSSYKALFILSINYFLAFCRWQKITDWIRLSMKIEEKTFPAAFDLMTSFAIETDQFQSNKKKHDY